MIRCKDIYLITVLMISFDIVEYITPNVVEKDILHKEIILLSKYYLIEITVFPAALYGNCTQSRILVSTNLVLITQIERFARFE